MEICITFLGAARNVTGSKYLVEVNGIRLLIDCGLYQERGLKNLNWEPFHISPDKLDIVLLTHAHLDHCGLIPKLVKEGFSGRIYCTPATTEIAKIVLLDSAKIQEEDAAYKQKRHNRENRKGDYPEIPLYTKEDAEASFPFFYSIAYEQKLDLGNGIEAVFYDAGHILGSASIKLLVKSNGEERTLIFSGDIGKKNTPILQDPTVFHQADYVVMESTYGNKGTPSSAADIHEILSDIINNTNDNGGNVIIPSFAIERSQEVLYRLNELLRQDRIPHIMVFLDSPMAIRVTDVFRHHTDLFDEEAAELLRSGEHPCDLPGLQLCRTVDESKAINYIRGSVVIIAGSGMCNGGRVRHHLINNIFRPECTILFIGYQAIGTLGRQIVDGAKTVRIHGKHFPVKAKVIKVDGFSAHADKDGLLQWISAFRNNPPRKVFITHGEEEASKEFAEAVEQKLGFNTERPSRGDKYVLD
ncbi:MAG: MBL fold metallo-hydrolase [Candidatus Scalindua rubra]|uniref:RNA-metabolising metallo-beta-lactamase n=1 Tax=Candidatus Scalindua brodae TaxID=237368 RepID=A0A0B0ERM5_9BACT|nr:MAG: RNA-metabolising metallo-beta-lactamase [Candidatus Scalindua brodae]MBZ0110191.1 MBL fold metallo-hydrolase [Candidatus Scalindua rubra]TWU30598.1 Ribonuclease [Candidatus Brocadiaceae bacterium S225]